MARKIDTSFADLHWVRIPKSENDGEGSYLYALIYRDANDISIGKKRPYIIAAHGMNCTAESIEWFSVPLVRAGFHVIAFNQNGHGLSPHRSTGIKHSYPGIMLNIHDVVRFVKSREDIAIDACGKPLIGFVGHSTGGVMALSQSYLNPDIKVIVAMSQIHDFMALVHHKYPLTFPQFLFKLGFKLGRVKIDYNEEENRIISPKYCLRPDPRNKDRVFMIHAQDDVLPIEEAYSNRDLAQLPPENCLFFKKGGHALQGQETVAVGQIIAWFLEYMYK